MSFNLSFSFTVFISVCKMLGGQDRIEWSKVKAYLLNIKEKLCKIPINGVIMLHFCVDKVTLQPQSTSKNSRQSQHPWTSLRLFRWLVVAASLLSAGATLDQGNHTAVVAVTALTGANQAVLSVDDLELEVWRYVSGTES